MRIAAAAAALVALSLAACASSSNGTPTSAPSSESQPSSSTPPSPTSFPTSPATSAATSGGLTEAQAQAALLTAAEVGGGFAATTSDNTDNPLPCTPNDPPLSQQFPPAVKVQADLAGLAGNALFSEEIETYADSSTVAQVIAAGEQGLGCSTATVSGTAVTIDGPTDLSSAAKVPVDKAEAWTLTSSALNASLIIVQMHSVLVVYSFGAVPGTDTSKLPDSEKILDGGLAKVAAALK